MSFRKAVANFIQQVNDVYYSMEEDLTQAGSMSGHIRKGGR